MKRKSLTDFAQESPPQTGPSAWITTIPEWQEVVEAYKSGIRLSTIRRWLIEECGYDPNLATYQRVAHLSNKYGGRRG